MYPRKFFSVCDLVLWDGPLGKTIRGTHLDLEEVTLMAHTSTAAVKYSELVQYSKDPVSCQSPDHPRTQCNTATSSRDFLKWWKWESIGAACEPRCGGCRCGNCQPERKEVTLAEEREKEMVRNGLTYVNRDHHSPEPHRHAKYPWTEDPASLPNNRRAVEATFHKTEKQLVKEPEWKTAYTSRP